MNNVFAASIGKRDCNTLPAPSWKWASMECQQFLVLHLRYYEWRLTKNIDTHGVGSLYWQMSRGYSRNSLQDSNNLFHVQSYHQLFRSLLAYSNSENDVYNQQQPHCALINHHAMPTIVDTPLTLILKLMQGTFTFLFFLWRWPILCLWLCGTSHPSEYPGYMTNPSWWSVDAHFQEGVGCAPLFVLINKEANTSKTDSTVPKSISCD